MIQFNASRSIRVDNSRWMFQWKKGRRIFPQFKRIRKRSRRLVFAEAINRRVITSHCARAKRQETDGNLFTDVIRSLLPAPILLEVDFLSRLRSFMSRRYQLDVLYDFSAYFGWTLLMFNGVDDETGNTWARLRRAFDKRSFYFWVLKLWNKNSLFKFNINQNF